MANTLTNIMPKILARGLMALRERCVLPTLVNMDYGTEAAQKGDTINIPIPTASTTEAVTPNHVPTAADDNIFDNVTISLDKWYKNRAFHLTDKELTQVDRNQDYVPMLVGEAMRGIANQINTDLFGLYTSVGNQANPDSSSIAVEDIVEARKLLNQSNCPSDNRVGVINFEAEAALLSIADFTGANTSGDANSRREGEIGRKYGINWFADDSCPLFTSGTAVWAAGNVTGTGTQGSRTLTLTEVAAADTETIVLGDSFTIAGDTTVYSIVGLPAAAAAHTIVNAAAFAVTISPGLRSTVTDANVLLHGASAAASTVARTGMVFHRDAFALATRPLMASATDLSLGSNMMSMTDPVSGLSLRLEVQRQYKQTTWEFDILYGVGCVRPEYACRLGTATS